MLARRCSFVRTSPDGLTNTYSLAQICCSVRTSPLTNAKRNFSIICLTSCSLLLFSEFCWADDCPNANESMAILIVTCRIQFFIIQLLHSLITDLKNAAQVLTLFRVINVDFDPSRRGTALGAVSCSFSPYAFSRKPSAARASLHTTN